MQFKAEKVDDSRLETTDSIELSQSSLLSRQVGEICCIGLKIGYAAFHV